MTGYVRTLCVVLVINNQINKVTTFDANYFNDAESYFEKKVREMAGSDHDEDEIQDILEDGLYSFCNGSLTLIDSRK